MLYDLRESQHLVPSVGRNVKSKLNFIDCVGSSLILKFCIIFATIIIPSICDNKNIVLNKQFPFENK